MSEFHQFSPWRRYYKLYSPGDVSSLPQNLQDPAHGLDFRRNHLLVVSLERINQKNKSESTVAADIVDDHNFYRNGRVQYSDADNIEMYAGDWKTLSVITQGLTAQGFPSESLG